MDILAMAKFFYLICKALFVSFLAFRKLKRKLLGLVSNYFAIIETNGHGMLHLHYLVWLKEVTPLVTIRSQIQDNHEFFQRLFAIFDHIIKYSASLNPHLETIYQICSNVNNSLNAPEFTTLLKKNSKSVVYKVQMHPLSHKSICFKYNTRKIRVCRFDFPWPI